MPTLFASQTITITAATLANDVARESSQVVSDTTVVLNDYRITVKPTLVAGSTSGLRLVYVWVKTSSNGTNWDGNATSSDANITLDNPHQFVPGVVIPFLAGGVARGGSFSLKEACGGSIPRNWGIIIENRTGLAFSACAVECSKEYVS